MTDNKNTERTGGFEKEKPGAARPGWTYEKVLEPNRMEYEDGDGLKHAIYMPKGTASKAGQHLVKQEWGELAKFPRWGKFREPTNYQRETNSQHA